MTTKIKINGPIISSDEKWFYDWFGKESTCPKDVLDMLPTNGEDVEVTINSYGGLVDMGNEIYTALRSYEGNVTANVVMAGSAASIIAMAAEKIVISPVGQIMIHNVSMGADGDYHDMEKASEILQKANQSLANAYVSKTGKSKEEVLTLMENETWLTAEEAVEHGFADAIMFENAERPLLVADGGSGMVDHKIIDEMRRLKNQQPIAQINLPDKQLQEVVAAALENLKQTTMINGKTLAQLEKENDTENEKSPFERLLF